MLQKRYQYIGSKGEILWTKWFKTLSLNKEPIQFKGRRTLKNEYRYVGD